MEKPKLYTRHALLLFSALLTPFFGAVLFAQNLNEVGKNRDILGIFVFAIIWNVTVLRFSTRFIPNPTLAFVISGMLGGVIVAFPFWNHYFKDVDEFEKRSIWGPLIMFVVLVGGFIAFVLSHRQ